MSIKILDIEKVVNTAAVGNPKPGDVKLYVDPNDKLIMVKDDGDTNQVGSVPDGGTTGQVLKKASNTDQDLVWGSGTTVTGTANSFAYFNSLGELDSIAGWAKQASAGENVNLTLQPNNLGGGAAVHYRNSVFEPLQNSPNESWNVFTHAAYLDNASSGFSMGTSGEAITLHNLYISHQGTGDVGTPVFLKLSSNIGNGTDAIDVKGLSFAYGFSSINANVNLSGPIQGWGFQLATNAATTASANTYVNAFYDFANIANAIDAYASFSASPTLAEIRNNANYTGINLNPTISTFSGNASFTGIALAGTVTNMGTGGWQGVVLNPTVSDSAYANGLYIDMSNVTSSGTIKAASFIGDVDITGAFSFTGALSIGQVNAYMTESLTDGGGTPDSGHFIVSAPTAAASATIANADYLGVNTASLINLGANSTITTAFLGVAALGLPAVLTMGAGATVDRIAGAVFALSLDAGAGGGTVDQLSLGRFMALPNGITTVNRLYGVEVNLPFGAVATDEWGGSKAVPGREVMHIIWLILAKKDSLRIDKMVTFWYDAASL
jgi:hypothetical protein